MRTLPLPRFARRILPVVLVCLSLWTTLSAAADHKASYLAALESISAEGLARHVDHLAADALEGREAGSRGGRAAGDYLGQQWAKLGLRGAGVDGGYFQPFPPNFRNIAALLQGNDPELKNQVVLVGAHYDHVGLGTYRNSRGPTGYVHNGADDNASGASGVLEMARAFTLLGEPPKRSVLFVNFDGEEKGLLGSRYFVAHPTVPLDRVVSMLNLDMIGRLRDDRLTVYGARSGYGLRRLLCQQNQGPGLLLDLPWGISDEADHYPFFVRNIPVLMLHTGEHNEYHTPYDRAKLINRAGMSRVVRLLFALVYDLAERPDVPRIRQAAGRETEEGRRLSPVVASRLADRLGVGWGDENQSPEGLRLTRVHAGSAAEKAGLRMGDRIARFAGREVRSGSDLIGAVQCAESPAQAIVRRPGQPEPLELSIQLDGTPLRLGITWRVDDAEPGAVMLTYVVPGSPAAAAGLLAGDRIYQIAGRDFTDDAQLGEMAKTLPEPIDLLVERNGQVRTVTVRLSAEPLKRAA